MKHKITRDNYESFFLDYLEGNLEENLIDQFLDFLEKNPDLKEELHLFENIHLPEQPLVFSEKKQLYKTPADEKEAFGLKAIALMEGDLKEKERRLFENQLAQHPELHKEAALFQQTRLVADQHITYPGKDQLYKSSSTVILMNWLGRIAAVAILLWGIHSFFQSQKPITSPTTLNPVASVKTPDTAAPKIESPQAETKTESVQLAENNPVPQSQPKARPESLTATTKPLDIDPSFQREMLSEITPLTAQLESNPGQDELAAIQRINSPVIDDPDNDATLDEYLASRAKKATGDGLRSAHRILRVGLNVASELSGERIEYSVKNGKVASLGFDSKLLAFSIPLQKNKK